MPVVAGTIGLFCLTQILIRKLPAPRIRRIAIILSYMGIGFVLGLFENYGLDGFSLFSGLIIGIWELFVRLILRRLIDEEAIDILPLWWLLINFDGGGGFRFPMDAFWLTLVSIPLALLLVIPAYVALYWLDISGRIVHEFTAPFCIMTRFRQVICNYCLRYTEALVAVYRCGKRFCEHCGGEIEFSRETGKAVVVFGQFSLESITGRVFVLKDIQHEVWEGRQIDVSEIYIDTESCDARLLERFITHLLHTPPKLGIGPVKVFHQGRLDELPANLHNALRNNFSPIEEFVERTPLPHLSENRQLPQYKRFLNPIKSSATEKTFLKASHAGAKIGEVLAVISGLVFLGFLIKIPQETEPSMFSFYGKLILGAWLGVSFVLGRRKAEKFPVGRRKVGRYPGLISKTKSIPLKEWLFGFALLGSIAAIVIPNILTGVSRSPQKRTMADMRAIGTALGSYQVDYEQIPRYQHEDSSIAEAD